jgi:hypothetical protein
MEDNHAPAATSAGSPGADKKALKTSPSMATEAERLEAQGTPLCALARRPLPDLFVAKPPDQKIGRDPNRV